MIKNYLLIAFLITSFQLFSQEVYFLTGSNFTKYVFNSSNGSMATPLQSGTGSSYEIGFSRPTKTEKFYYNIALTLNDYNAVAGSQFESYRWDTKYIGVQNAATYNFDVFNDFQLTLKGGVTLSTIIYGKQNSNGAIYDLMRQAEFSGIVLSPFVGLQTRYKVNDLGYLSLGYAFSQNLKPFNSSPEKLSFNTNQILFGIHFAINKK